MASSSVTMIRSQTLRARNSLFNEACNCLRQESGKIKGKGRAAFHQSSAAREEPQQSTSTATVSLEDQLESVQLQPSTQATAQAMKTATREAPRPARSATPVGGIDMHEVHERKRRMLLMDELESLGSSQTRENTWQPHHSFTRTKKPANVTLSNLLAATAHLGHSKALNNPMSFPYIYGTRHGISIIDVRETLSALRRAAALVKSTVENDGIVLFVGGKGMKDSDPVLSANAAKMGAHGYATSRWLPGTLTNASTLFSASKTMIKEDGVHSTGLHPSLIVLFAPLSTPHVLREANSLSIPTIALCDSNVDPRHFTYPIPCNDDSLRVVELVSGVLAEAGKDGAKRKAFKERQMQASNQQIEQEYLSQQRDMYISRQKRLR